MDEARTRAFIHEHPDEALLWHLVFDHDVAALKRHLSRKPKINLEMRHPGPGTTVLFAAAEEYFDEAKGIHDFEGAPQRSGGRAFKVLELLLRRGADVNASFLNPSTGNMIFPMSAICAYGLTEGAQLFIDAAKDLDVMSPGNAELSRLAFGVLWPLTQAISNGHTDIALMLIRHSSFKSGQDARVLAVAAEAGDSKVLGELLTLPGTARVINLPHPNPQRAGGTPLTCACWSGHACVEALLAAGADPLIDRSGKRPSGVEPDSPRLNMTPMACAISSGADPHVIDLLVKAGAHRPQIVLRGSGLPVFVGRDGSEEEIIDMRTLSASGKGGRMPVKISTDIISDVARPSSSSGLFDARFDKFACAACGKLPDFGVALLRCGRCKRAAYCNAACQKSHWRQHKKECAEPA
jgi:hypothetical protein